MVDEDDLRTAVSLIAGTDGLQMDADDLVEDVYLLAFAFPDRDDFRAAVASTWRALASIAKGEVDTSPLKYGLESWRSYHYQHRVGQGNKANCRIVFRRCGGDVEVKGFGHRRIPKDFYARMSASRREM